jgi:hypothetical protein
MRRSALLKAAAFALFVCCAHAGASTLSPSEVRWAQRGRAVWRAYRVDWDSKAKMLQAERNLLGAGSRREAAAALRSVLRKLPLPDPARYPIGFAMALLDLDYRDGRDVLIRYLRAGGMPYGVELSRHSVVADPNDDPREADIADDTDGLAGMVYFVYRRHQDSVLLSALLDTVRHADGAYADILDGVLHNLARDYPRGLLAGLRAEPREIWRRAAVGLAIETRHGANCSHVSVSAEYPQMSRIAANKRDPLRRPARRLLDEVRREQQREDAAVRGARSAAAGECRPESGRH